MWSQDLLYLSTDQQGETWDKKKYLFLTLGFVTNNKQREQTRTKEREYLFANAEQRTNNFAEKSHLNPSLTL